MFPGLTAWLHVTASVGTPEIDLTKSPFDAHRAVEERHRVPAHGVWPALQPQPYLGDGATEGEREGVGVSETLDGSYPEQ